MTPKRSTRTRLVLLACAAAVSGLFATPGSAAPSRPDLVTTITAPSGVSVYQSGRWGVTVRNLGNRDASNVSLTIQLPRTANSPTQYVMGTLGAMSPGCGRSGFTIVCSLGTVGRRILSTSTRTITFDITLPYSTNPIAFTASAPVTDDANPADNTANATASLSTYAVSFAAPRTVRNTHCTGTAALSSFVECVSGSTSWFDAELQAGSTPTSGPARVPANGAGGTWTLNGTQLTIVYQDGATVEGIFVGQGTSPSCWEGRMTFPSTTQYVALYQVCLR